MRNVRKMIICRTTIWGEAGLANAVGWPWALSGVWSGNIPAIFPICQWHMGDSWVQSSSGLKPCRTLCVDDIPPEPRASVLECGGPPPLYAVRPNGGRVNRNCPIAAVSTLQDQNRYTN